MDRLQIDAPRSRTRHHEGSGRLADQRPRHARGWRIRLFQKRFKPSTSQETVEEELSKARKRWRAGRAEPIETPSTLKATSTDYLAHYFAGRAGLKERTRHLQLWVDALEPVDRTDAR
jgi:hypothetical protein